MSLRALLDALVAATDVPASVARDPVRFVHRYPAPRDAEIAGAFAAQLAFGRVELFGAVLERLFATMDAHGGPAPWAAAGGPGLSGLYYRWFDDQDFVALARTLARAQAERGSIEAWFPAGPAGEALEAGLQALRPVGSRALGTWFPSPRRGSACKRWLLYLRWMVRRDEVDRGHWTTWRPRDLVVPVDTHVHQVATLLGLTRRRAADWKTALEITEALRACDPDDPVRYDFALAHLGITRRCRGRADIALCPTCPLQSGCAAGRHFTGSQPVPDPAPPTQVNVSPVV